LYSELLYAIIPNFFPTLCCSTSHYIFITSPLHVKWGWLVLRLLYIFRVFVCWSVGLCIPIYRVRNNYVTYIAATWLDFRQLGNLDRYFL